ncbi:restriction endonuclease subunit S [Staphylococcus hominis]|uniref:restriction endonuclease subunit S n=1 Tax=Staphylococcus hominis TaxID=1290 RepID=UPI0034D4EE03
MTNEQKNLPELRFPEFDGEWEEKQLSTILEIGTGKSKVQSNENGKYNILGSTGIIGKSHTYDYEGDFILTARVGHYAGKLYKHAGKVNISDNTIYLYNFINKNFIYESLNVFKLEKLVFGSGQPLIKASDLKKLKIRVPVSKEQKKIGTFFSKLDRQIELEEEKLELLEQQKRGYMQQIFSQDLRFKDENGDDYVAWKETTIKEIAEIKTGSKDTKDAREDGNYNFYVRSPIIHKINSYSYDGEAILTVGDGVGVGKVFHYVNGKFDYHQRVYKISDFKNYYGLLLYYYFSKNFLKEARKYNAKTSVDSVRKDMIANMKVPMPIMEEQQKIGMFLKKLESRIDYQNSKINLLNQRKRGFLQKMFV